MKDSWSINTLATTSFSKKMVALTALMRKIIVIANARVRDYLSVKNEALTLES
jgi:hypothetical protein